MWPVISSSWPATSHAVPAVNAKQKINTTTTAGTQPNRALSRRPTNGVSKKLRTRAKAKGTNIWRPKYSEATARASAMRIDDLEEVVEFEERTNAGPPVQSVQFRPLSQLSPRGGIIASRARHDLLLGLAGAL